jgi:putative membrane protein
MKIAFGAALLAASILAAPAFAQTTIIPMPAAPAPSAVGPPMASGIPASPLTSGDTLFIKSELQANFSQIQVARLALLNSQDQNIRNFAQKLIADHTAANATLMMIAERQDISAPTMVSPGDQVVMDRLSTLSGVAFDTAYINRMIGSHEMMLQQMNDQLAGGQSQIINVWVQNARPVVMQQEQIAEAIKAELPRAG